MSEAVKKPTEIIKQVIVVRKDLNMRKGKIAAQVAHAAMMFLVTKMYRTVLGNQEWHSRFDTFVTDVQRQWLEGQFTKVVPYCNSEAELRDLIQKAQDAGIVVHECMDNGLTEFHGVKTLTCAAFGPDLPSVLDPITGHLSLL